MNRFTVGWVLFVFCVGFVLGKPTKHKSTAKKIVKRWDLLVNQDPLGSKVEGSGAAFCRRCVNACRRRRKPLNGKKLSPLPLLPERHKRRERPVPSSEEVVLKSAANLLKNPPADCQKIIDEYSNGKILMYEYKIQMGRCLKKANGGDSTADADVKSALLRPDDSSPKEDSDQAVNVRPFNEQAKDKYDDDDYDTNLDESRENDNDNDNDYRDDDDDDEEPDELADKKMLVPGPLGYQAPNIPMTGNIMPAQQQQGMPEQQAAFFNTNMEQTQYNAAPAPFPQQTPAAFAPSPMNQYPDSPAPFLQPDPNMAMNPVVKSDIPESAQPQAPASQANAVFDQWRASSFGAATADKKDQSPSAPAVPANDEFAEFMKMQSASSNSMEAAPASQQTAVPAATQQRSDIQQMPNMFPMQPQTPNTVPGQSQAFYLQPEENGDFPESP